MRLKKCLERIEERLFPSIILRMEEERRGGKRQLVVVLGSPFYISIYCSLQYWTFLLLLLVPPGRAAILPPHRDNNQLSSFGFEWKPKKCPAVPFFFFFFFWTRPQPTQILECSNVPNCSVSCCNRDTRGVNGGRYHTNQYVTLSNDDRLCPKSKETTTPKEEEA